MNSSNKLRLFFILGILLNFFVAQSQFKQQSGFMDKIYFGGWGGLGGGTDYFNLNLSPLVGYKFTDKFSAGLITTYHYVRVVDVNQSNYGGGPFLRYNVTEKFFGYAEFEYLSFKFSPQGGVNERRSFESLYFGIGYTEPIGDLLSFNITALYNVIYGDGLTSAYDTPLRFRFGIIAGLY